MPPESPQPKRQPDKETLREYSKAHDAEYLETYGMPSDRSRGAIVEAIQRQRQLIREDHQYDDQRLRQITHIIARNQQTIERQHQEALTFEQKVATLQQLVQDHETSLVKRIFDRFHPQELDNLKQDLAEAQPQLAKANAAYTDIKRTYDNSALEAEMANIRANRQSLNAKPLEYINKYYEQVANQWKFNQQNEAQRAELAVYKQEHGSAREQVLSKGHYLVHGVTYRFDKGFGNNRTINNQSDYKDRIAYALLHKPTLCASSFEPISGNNETAGIGLWSNFGVVLNSGTIEAADIRDSASAVDENGNRYYHVPDSVERYKESIASTLAAGSSPKYNEIVVSDPQSVAVFITLRRN